MADIVKRIVSSDYELQTIQTNLANQIDSIASVSSSGKLPDQIKLKPLIERVRGPGTPATIKTPALFIAGVTENTGQDSYVIGTPPTANGPATAASGTIYGPVNHFGDLNQNGPSILNDNVVINPKGVNGVIINPKVAGPAFYVTNAPNTIAMFIVNESGFLQTQSGATYSDTVQAPSFVSAAGFKQYIPLGYVNRTNTAAAIRSTETTSAGSFTVNQPMPFGGSVVGVSIALTSTVPVVQTITFFKNNVSFFVVTVPANSLTPPTGTVFPKGLIPFNTNDTWGAGGTSASSGTTLGVAQYPVVSYRIALIVEMGA